MAAELNLGNPRWTWKEMTSRPALCRKGVYLLSYCMSKNTLWVLGRRSRRSYMEKNIVSRYFMNTCTLTKIWTKHIDYYLPLRYETSSVGRLVRRVEQVELRHPTKKSIAWTNGHEWRQWFTLIPVYQRSYRRWVELGQPMMNLKGVDIQTSSLQERSVPVVVRNVQEPTVGPRMKVRKVLHRIKHSHMLLHEHMYE